MNNQQTANDSERYPLRRRELVAELVRVCSPQTLIVAGLGAPAWDVTAAGDRDLTFPLWGAMGGALMIGLGLALAQPERRVLVVTGDGELLMGAGSLASVAVQRPANLAVAVLDNERYGETGMQPTHTAFSTDLAALAKACGFVQAQQLTDAAQVREGLSLLARASGPLLVNFKVRAEDLPLVLPPKDGAYLKDRLRLALLGPAAVG